MEKNKGKTWMILHFDQEWEELFFVEFYFYKLFSPLKIA